MRLLTHICLIWPLVLAVVLLELITHLGRKAEKLQSRLIDIGLRLDERYRSKK